MSVTPPNVIAELHQIDQERRRLIQAERSIDQRQAAIEATRSSSSRTGQHTPSVWRSSPTGSSAAANAKREGHARLRACRLGSALPVRRRRRSWLRFRLGMAPSSRRRGCWSRM
jgi:hypothetical protein